MDPQPDRGHEYRDSHVRIALRESRDLYGDGDRGGGSDDRGEQSHESDRAGRDRGRLAAVSDRQGRERKPGGGGASDVRGRCEQRDGRPRHADRDRGGWDRDGDLLDAQPDRRTEHAHRDGIARRHHRQPGVLRGDRDSASAEFESIIGQCESQPDYRE